MGGPGRSCPLAYRYQPDDLAGPVSFACQGRSTHGTDLHLDQANRLRR